MPLTKSKSSKAFQENIKREIAAGKPQKQAVAIAYDVQRRAKKADGGDVTSAPKRFSETGPFTIVNRKTGKVVGKASTVQGARRSKDRNDNEYGGYIHQIMNSKGESGFKNGGGLYANIHAKRKRIAEGSGEKMRKPGSAGAPTAKAFQESAKTAKHAKGGGVSLSVKRGEKLPVSKGAGLTAKGRAKYNRETGSELKAPQPQGGARKKSFCARMSGVVKHSKGDAERAKASLRRWKCSGW